jgi:hypothetical protein
VVRDARPPTTAREGNTPSKLHFQFYGNEETKFPKKLPFCQLTAFPSPNTERPAGAYGRWRETELRPNFSDQRFRRILSTSRSALFRQSEAVRIRWRSSRTVRGWLQRLVRHLV